MKFKVKMHVNETLRKTGEVNDVDLGKNIWLQEWK